jgi:membrane associated rhomboid family serine protease
MLPLRDHLPTRSWAAVNYLLSGSTGVAFTAHIGGFVAGLILLPLLRTQDRVSHDRWDRLVRPREECGRW